MVGLTETRALEGAEHGVTAIAICRGHVRAPQITDTARERRMTGDEVMHDGLLAARATPAVSQITGTALPVDGGWTAHRRNRT